ncbi:MAG: tetratricopeptide repeat protein [Saprospiraceae bacterium]
MSVQIYLFRAILSNDGSKTLISPYFCIMIGRMLNTALLFLLFMGWMSCGGDKPAASSLQETDPALAQLNALISTFPLDDSLRRLRAEYYYNVEAYDEALADLGAAMQLDSMNPVTHHLLADVLLDYGRPNDSKRAIIVLEEAARKFPDRIPTLLKLSEFQLIVKQHSDALKTLDRILQRDPQNADAFYMAGRVALDQGDTTRSIVALRKSLTFDADNEDAWLILGRIYTNRKNPQALQCFDNALRIDSTLLEAVEYKAAYYKRMGQFDEAFAIYRDIIRRNPDYSNAFFDMGMIYLEMDSLKKAYGHFNLAIQTDPLFVKAYYYRGLTNELSGNIDAAKADYSQASRMAPSYPEPKEALERLK